MAAEYGKVCCCALKIQNISITVMSAASGTAMSAAVTSRVATATTTTKVEMVMAAVIKVIQEIHLLETKETRIISQNRANGPQMVIRSQARNKR